jgi:L-arabinose isomerase
VRVGIFGIGLAAYWPQFDGLRERLEGYQRGIEAQLERDGRRGRLGRPRRHGAGCARGRRALAAHVDLVLVYAATYATSSQVLPAVQALDAPVVILNLQPTRTLDYEAMTTAEWLANCSACCVPEIAGAFTRARIPYRTVTGTLLDGDPAWGVLREWLDAASAVRSLRARVSASSATPTRACSTCTPTSRRCTRRSERTSRCSRSTISSSASRRRRRGDRAQGRRDPRTFDLADAGTDPIADEITPEIFDWSARVAVGLDRLVADFELDGLTYYYRGVGGNIAERVAPA